MMNSNLSNLAIAAMAALLVAGQAHAQDATIQALPAQPPTPAVSKRVIVVSLEDRKLALLEGGHVKRVYTVAVGKPSTPSPVGTFTIERRVANPTYHHDGKTVLPGPRNPVGTRWMGLSKHGYGIHGTNEPHSIGKAASHGCIRMAKADLEELFSLVAEGDEVDLIGQPNEQTAQLFGNSENPLAAPAKQTTAVASSTVPEPTPATNRTDKTNAADHAAVPTIVLAELL